MTDRANGQEWVLPRWLAHVALWVLLAVASAAGTVSVWAVLTMWDVGVFVGEAREVMSANRKGLDAVTIKAGVNGEAIARLEGRYAPGGNQRINGVR